MCPVPHFVPKMANTSAWPCRVLGWRPEGWYARAWETPWGPGIILMFYSAVCSIASHPLSRLFARRLGASRLRERTDDHRVKSRCGCQFHRGVHGLTEPCNCGTVMVPWCRGTHGSGPCDGRTGDENADTPPALFLIPSHGVWWCTHPLGQ